MVQWYHGTTDALPPQTCDHSQWILTWTRDDRQENLRPPRHSSSRADSDRCSAGKGAAQGAQGPRGIPRLVARRPARRHRPACFGKQAALQASDAGKNRAAAACLRLRAGRGGQSSAPRAGRRLMMTSDSMVSTFLLAFGALFSIVNPLSGTFIFFGATRELEPRVRAQVSRWVAIYAFLIVTASLYVGAYVLSFFGISIPVLRVAGGIVVAASGWRMLNEPDATEQRRSETPSPRSMDVSPSRLAFYPLTMPLTTGPGTISVAISLR